jgi:hypothetical protein
MHRLLATAFALAAGAFAAAPAAAQDEWEAQVGRILAQASAQYEQRGYHPSHAVHTGALNNGAGEDVTVPLEAGVQYQIVGVCDTDCTDLDLRLVNPDGVDVDSDAQADDLPIVSVTPSRAGSYRIHVVMAACSAEPCRYGLGIYAK